MQEEHEHHLLARLEVAGIVQEEPAPRPRIARLAGITLGPQQWRGGRRRAGTKRQPRQAGGQQAIERGSKGSDGHLMCLSVCAQLLI